MSRGGEGSLDDTTGVMRWMGFWDDAPCAFKEMEDLDLSMGFHACRLLSHMMIKQCLCKDWQSKFSTNG